MTKKLLSVCTLRGARKAPTLASNKAVTLAVSETFCPASVMNDGDKAFTINGLSIVDTLFHLSAQNLERELGVNR